MQPAGGDGSAAAPTVLISCYELGHEPLGTSVPAGVLGRAGIRAHTMDVAVGEFDADLVARAGLIAISAPMHTALRLGMRVAARAREINPTAHICFYGLYAHLHAHRLVPAHADSCLGAECESALVDLARSLSTASEPRRIVPPAPPAARERPGRGMDLTPLRVPGAHRDRYVKLLHDGERRAVGYVQATRGCKHLCRHCPVPAAYGGRFYAIPVARVLDDIARAVESGARHITFADADFLNGPTHALRIARELRRRFGGISFDYTAKIEHLRRHRDAVAELRDLGNLFVVSAVESFDDRVLRHLDKGHTRADALEVIDRFRRLGLTLRPSLVPFTPWETRAGLGELLDIVESEGLVGCIDAVQYSIRLLVPEGSLLLREASMRAHLGEFDSGTMSYRWRHPDAGMDRLQARLAMVAAEASADGVSGGEAFDRVRRAVDPARPARPAPARAGAAPRLTEDWFC